MLINKFFLVRLSPSPIILSFGIGNLLLGLILTDKYYILISLLCVFLSTLGWLYEIYLESHLEGAHSNDQSQILYVAFILFLLSEVLIFGTLFGSFFYNSIIPSIETYNEYIYHGINSVNPLSLPLLNTILLYLSGLTCTIFINSLAMRKGHVEYLILTIVLSSIFSYIQYYEYNNTLFTIIDGIYGTNFFILTGFHGLHVIVGTLFLIYSLIRYLTNSIRFNNKVGVISSSLYWHFVDYVWILLYLALYQWGG